MPELPEVETIRRQLAGTIKGAAIKSVEVRNSRPLNVTREKFIGALCGAKIKEIGRRAKLLIFYLSNGRDLLFHLKLTGRLLLVSKNEPPTKHTHLIFNLSGPYNLFFEDYRKFGFVKLLSEADLEKYLEDESYGPEPLSADFNYKIMKTCLLSHKNKKIKELLMDQTCLAGIGNIYAAEICFYAGVRPSRPIADLSEIEFKKIYQGAKKILTAAIVSRGTSTDAYLDVYGQQGAFVPKLKVYGREDKKCVQCGALIKKTSMAGRGTYFCPQCQR